MFFIDVFGMLLFLIVLYVGILVVIDIVLSGLIVLLKILKLNRLAMILEDTKDELL